MDLAEAAFLCSPRGRAAVTAVQAALALASDARAAALHARRTAAAAHAALEPSGTDEEARAALRQAGLQERARAKTPHAERLLFTREALEQATPWPVATERASRWPLPPGARVADLGAGVGLDALALASTGRRVLAVERDPVRVRLLAANVEALGLAAVVEVVEGDAAMRPFDAVGAFLDPDRRPEGRRTRDPERFEPPASRWADLLAPYAVAVVKAPPAEPRGLSAAVPFEVVSLGGEARERRLLWRGFPDAPPRRALALPSGAEIAGPGRPWPAPRTPRPGLWLLDPDPAVTLAGLVGDLCLRDGLAPLHPRIAYLVGDAPTAAAPGTWLRIDAVLAPEARALNAWLAAEQVGRVEVRCRGVSDDAETWRRRLRPTGNRAATLVFTRGPDDRWIALGSVTGA